MHPPILRTIRPTEASGRTVRHLSRQPSGTAPAPPSETGCRAVRSRKIRSPFKRKPFSSHGFFRLSDSRVFVRFAHVPEPERSRLRSGNRAYRAQRP